MAVSKEKSSEYNRRYYEKHAERLRERTLAYYHANKERIAAQYIERREAKLRRMRERRLGPEAAMLQARARARYAENPAPALARAHKRRAIKAQAAVGTDRKQYAVAVRQIRESGVCRWCGVSGVRLHVDHIVPLARGGPDDASNLCGACQKCNQSRGARLPEEWPYRPTPKR